MRKVDCTLFFIFIAIFRITADTIDSDTHQPKLLFPMYENTKVFYDYRLSQAIDLGLDWCSVGIISGAAISGILYPLFVDNHRYDEFGTPICMAAFGIIGGSIGLISGSTAGIIKGKKYNIQREQNNEFHLRMDWIGYEVWIAYVGFDEKTNDDKYFRSDLPGGSFTFRLDRFNLNLLDEIRVGFIADLRWRNMETDSLTLFNDLDASELRWSADFLKKFPLLKGYIVPYAGLACGGAKLFINQRFENRPEKKETTFLPFFDIITGVEFNAFDFIFIRPEISYEIYGPYYKLKKYAEISPLRNLRFSLRSGCLLF